MLAIIVDTRISHRYSLQYEAFDTEALRMFLFQCYFIMRIGGRKKKKNALTAQKRAKWPITRAKEAAVFNPIEEPE